MPPRGPSDSSRTEELLAAILTELQRGNDLLSQTGARGAAGGGAGSSPTGSSPQPALGDSAGSGDKLSQLRGDLGNIRSQVSGLGGGLVGMGIGAFQQAGGAALGAANDLTAPYLTQTERNLNAIQGLASYVPGAGAALNIINNVTGANVGRDIARGTRQRVQSYIANQVEAGVEPSEDEILSVTKSFQALEAKRAALFTDKVQKALEKAEAESDDPYVKALRDNTAQLASLTSNLAGFGAGAAGAGAGAFAGPFAPFVGPAIKEGANRLFGGK